jgi:iron-sulfur cluster repair protein YtfE (RIC family)
MSRTESLKKDHQIILDKFDQAARHRGADRHFYLEDLETTLCSHLAEEMDVLAPELASIDGGQEILSSFEREEERTAHLLATLKQIEAEESHIKRKLKTLRKRIKDHFFYEERFIFPMIEHHQVMPFKMAS